MMKSKSVLKTENLSVGYPGKTVLESVNLDFYSGEFVSLLGPNGVGKSTLLRTLSRLLSIRKGRVLVMGKSLDTIPAPELAKVMSVVLTHKAVPPLFQAYDFVAMGRYPHTRWTGRLDTEDDRVVMDALSMVRAQDLILRDMSTLSDGERQKILIARALAQEPEIILLDEPTMHLDLKHRMEIMSILKDMCRKKGICVVASLHDIEVASRVSDRVALIQNNTIARFGPPEDVLLEDTVSDLYDFGDAGFSRLLGNIEFRGSMEKGAVFVIGGMGSASVLYRLLSKKGYRVKTGVLFKNDVDYHVAKSLNINPLIENTLQPVSDHSIKSALSALQECDAVVDAGFEAADLNRGNLTLIDSAKQLGKPVFRLNGTPSNGIMRPEISMDMTASTESALVGLIDRKMAEMS
ncbi:ABC transporter ATP-binding protein [Desulfocicer niacini]